MTKPRLKNFSNRMGNSSQVWGKVMKLHEEHQLLGRCHVIQTSLPELVLRLEEMMGDYEIAVISHSFLTVDGPLLLPADKSRFLINNQLRIPIRSINN